MRFLQKCKYKLEIETEFSRKAMVYLREEGRYSKYSLSLYLNDSSSYKIFTKFITTIGHLNLLSFDRIVCQANSGEYECYVDLVKTFIALKLDVSKLYNYDLFEYSGKFFPEDNSIPYLHTTRSVNELKATKIVDHLELKKLLF
jgi:hypothetical protein